MSGLSAWPARVRSLRRYRTRVVDVLVAIVCAVSSAGPAMDSTLFGGSPYLAWRPPAAVILPVAAMIALAALARRHRPLALVAAGLVGWVVAAAYPTVIIGQYSLGAHGRSRRVTVGATVLVTLAVAVPFWRQGLDSIFPISVAVCCAPTVLGLWASSRRELLASLRERAERAERERHLLADQARTEERTRIAHDMHDVVTHRVSLMVLHATAAEVAPTDERDTLVRRIRSIGREALTELRTLVDVLHTADDDALLAPQPGLADLYRLAKDSTSAGIPVAIETVGRVRALPTVIEHGGYRVVQEALTNVHKHAGSASVEVLLRYESDQVIISITNGPGNGGYQTSPTSGGHGLIGLRERVRLLGGQLTAGPRPDGGFELTATIPVPRQAKT